MAIGLSPIQEVMHIAAGNMHTIWPFRRFVHIAVFFFIAITLPSKAAATKENEKVGLTQEEQTWLNQNPEKLVLYYDAKFPPFEFTSANGAFAGFGADIITHIEKALNITFIKTPSNNWNDLLQAMESGECAIVSTIAKTPEREQFIFFTNPYAVVPIVIITGSKTSQQIAIRDLTNLKVGVVAGYATEKYMQRQAVIHSFSVITVPNIEEGLHSLSFGQIDAFVEDLAVAAYYIDQKGIPNLKVAGVTPYNFEFCIGVSQKYPLLFSAIQKAFKYIPETKIKESQKKWFSLETHMGLSPEVRMLLKITGISLIILVISLLGISLLLKRQLNRKVIDLRENEHLFRTIFNLMPYSCVIKDADDRYTMVNEAYKAFIGLNDERLIGKTNEDIGVWLDANAKEKIAQGLTQKGKVENLVAKIKLREDEREAVILHSAQVIEIKGKKFIIATIVDITQQQESQRELEAKEKRTVLQKNAISKILLDQTINIGKPQDSLYRITEISSEAIGTERTSVWVYTKNHAAIVCKALYDKSTNSFSQGEMLDTSLFPTYFKSIEIDNRISAGDTASDPRTEALYKHYLKPLGITSLLDVGIIIEGKLVGVVSFEHTGSKRKWHPDEESFASTVAAIIAQHFEVTERKQAEEALSASEERFMKAFRSNPASMAISEIDSGRFIDVNDNNVALLGYTRDEQIGFTSKDLGLWANISVRDQLIEKLKKQGYLKNEPVVFKSKNGNLIPILWSAEIITLSNRKVMLSVIIDETDRKKAEEAIKTSEELFSKAFKSNPAPMVITEIESGQLIDVNENWVKMLGFNQDEQIGRTTKEIGIWKHSNDRDILLAKLKEQGFLKNEPVEFITKSGAEINVLWSAEIIRLKGKEVLLSILIDETDRRKAETNLKASEERFSKAFKSNPAPMVISEIDTGRFIDTNENWNKMLGFTRDELIGKTSKEIEIWKDSSTRDKLIVKLKEQGFLKNEPVDFVTKAKETIKTLWSVEVFTLENRKVMLSLIQNETDRLKAEEALKVSEERYRSIIAVSNTGAWEYHADTNYLWCSNEYFEMLGYDPLSFALNEKLNLADAWLNLLHPDDKDAVANRFSEYLAKGSAGIYQNHFRMRHCNGSWIWIWSRGQTLRNPDNSLSNVTLGTHINITENKNLELELRKHKENLENLVKERTEELALALEKLQASNHELFKQREDLEQTLKVLRETQDQLIQTEKMATLGILTAGVAHEINNPINYIYNGAMAIENYISDKLPNHKEEIKPLMDAINVGILRTTSIVRSLNRYSRRDTDTPTLCNVHEVIDNCLTMLHNQYKNRIEIHKDYIDGRAEITANEGTLHQVFLNILNNAIQAINDTGEISIKTIKRNNSVEIRIKDSGQGIAEENIKHIFDPFFTTKDPGKGTGLGLSITQRIIQEHNGTIDCVSKKGIGTEFIITLPANG